MAEEIGKAEAAAVFAQLKEVMEKNRGELTRLDAALGDGDLGMVMAKAFALVGEKTAAIREQASDPGMMFALAGMEIGKNAPSTMGTLVASGFMKAGKAVSGKQALGAPDMAVFIKTFADAVASLGGAARGDKTVLDVLYPASEAAERSAREGLGLGEVLARALASAQRGLEEGRGLMAKHGRPGIFREKTIGMTDPGSLAGVLILRAFCEALSQ
jgi:dihydroxyacetone kinase-like protein